MENPSTQTEKPDKPKTKAEVSAVHLRLHRFIVFLLYFLGGLATYFVLSSDQAQSSLIAVLASGSIFATLGAAISTIGSTFERDLLDRVLLNVDILYSDILKQKAWRRWPFLPRKGNRKLLNGDKHQAELSNPKLPVNVGTHTISVDFPTVLDDFFDLPLANNLFLVVRFRSAFHTWVAQCAKDYKNPDTGLDRGESYMAYECLFDIWVSVFKFRIARYAVHFGTALTISAILYVAYKIGVVGT